MQNFGKPRKNKTFYYAPRYSQGKGRSFTIARTRNTFRSTTPKARGLQSAFSSALEDLKIAGDKHLKLRFFSIVAVLIIVFLWIIDFDLSLFL